MFVRVSGLAAAGIEVPRSLRVPTNHTCDTNSVTLALVRCLSPHPHAVSRDEQLRPLCPPPFDINHALWTFTKTRQRRGYFSDNLFTRQIDLFPGSDRRSRRQFANTLTHARYDFIQLETIETFMNCTYIDGDTNHILETVTLPF